MEESLCECVVLSIRLLPSNTIGRGSPKAGQSSAARRLLCAGKRRLSPPVEGRQRIVIRRAVKRGDRPRSATRSRRTIFPPAVSMAIGTKLAPIVALAAVDAVVELIERDRASGGQ